VEVHVDVRALASRCLAHREWNAREHVELTARLHETELRRRVALNRELRSVGAIEFPWGRDASSLVENAAGIVERSARTHDSRSIASACRVDSVAIASERLTRLRAGTGSLWEAAILGRDIARRVPARNPRSCRCALIRRCRRGAVATTAAECERA
jgi:hypothetical protein